jgi:predicted ATPase
LFHIGEFLSAREHVEHALALYDPRHHRSRALQDLGVTSHSYLSWGLWLLGYPDQALATSHTALTLAQGLSHSFSVAFALIFAAGIHQFRGEGHTAQELAEKAIVLCREQEFPVWLAFGLIARGWALAGQGQEEEGIARMRQGLTAWEATGAEASRPFALALLAEARGRVGQAEEGLNLLTEALAIAHGNEERYFEAELYRLYGELSLRSGEAETGRTGDKTIRSDSPIPRFPVSSPEESFQKAIEIARKQQAKSLELRAVMSLSRLWQQQGKKAEARQMLAETYGWFTEGFDTKDLQEAKALLDSLGSSV